MLDPGYENHSLYEVRNMLPEQQQISIEKHGYKAYYILQTMMHLNLL